MTTVGKAYNTLSDLLDEHRWGYAVKHQPTPMFDDDEYYTWHPDRLAAVMELKRIRPVADEHIIDVEVAHRSRNGDV